MILDRKLISVGTRFGKVRVKVIEQPDGTKRATPEYDDLKRIASAKEIPLKLIHDEVMRQFTK
jgi:pyridinium-3,5-bisthiocarboxylic acid mononucleotide nickel chelatase